VVSVVSVVSVVRTPAQEIDFPGPQQQKESR
jgi:hypothetical protein